MKKLFLSVVAAMFATVCFAQSDLVATLTHNTSIVSYYGDNALVEAAEAATYLGYDSTLVGAYGGVNPSSMSKEAYRKIALQDADVESFNLITTGTFKSAFLKSSYTAELRQSDKNPNLFLITPFLINDEGIIVEITCKKTDAGASILNVVPASTGCVYGSYGMVSACDAVSYDGREREISNFDGTTFKLNLVYYVTEGSIGDYQETFIIPEGLVTYTEGPNDGILYYSITDASSREVSVIGLKDTERTAVNIPGNIEIDCETYTVTSIGDGAFMNCSALTSITIPNTVTTIGDGAFENCSALTSITIPNTVTTIGNASFSDCSGLTSIDLPDSLTTIEDRTFFQSGLESISIPNGVKSIGLGAFAECTDLRDVYISNSVKSIGELAFYHCTNLFFLTIGNGVASIQEGAFRECTHLMSVEIPESVTSIGEYAFAGCIWLGEVYAPRTNAARYNAENSVFSSCHLDAMKLHVPEGCREGYANLEPWSGFGNIVADIKKNGIEINDICYKLDSSTQTACVTYTGPEGEPNPCPTTYIGNITIPNQVIYNGITYTVTGIGENAFYGCYAIMWVTIPESVTSIGSYAFNDCTGLTVITIPASVTSIGSSAFNGCTSLTSITVDSRNQVYDSRENSNAIIKTKPNKLIFGCKNTVIPNSVTTIGDGAFEGCSGLTNIEIPNSVTSIGYSAFYGCSGLTNIEIPNSVTSIGYSAFEKCTNLTSIVIPNSVIFIDYNAFMGCSALTHVYALRTNAAEYNAENDAFFECPLESITLHVPEGSLDSYGHLEPWCDFGTITDDNETVIAPVEINCKAAAYYNLKGQLFKEPQQSINIIRFSDGTTKKVLVK